jgi:hypothetical protein
MTGIRVWISRTNSFGSPVIIVQVRSHSLVAGSFQPVAANGLEIWSSASHIPYIGYIIAPFAAAAAFAGVEAYGSAEGGCEIAPGRGAVGAMLHPTEMVLPADIAGGMKQLIASGGGGGA